MRIVVTGASGNIGTAVLRRLQADGEHDVVGVVRRPPEAVPPYDTVTWRPLDLTEPDAATLLRGWFDGADAVVHLAWGFQPTHDVPYLAALGVGGTRAVANAAVDAGVPHLVHMSSVGAYAPGSYGEPVDETWPTTGVPTSEYSSHKVAAERLLDDLEQSVKSAGTTVARLRPGFVLQRDAGSALVRYGLPFYVPSGVIGVLPLLPLDRRLQIPVVHSDDVADAVVRVLERRAAGAFNLAAEPAITRADLAAVIGARPVHVPSGVIGRLAAATWRARVQPLSPGWIDLAFSVPLLDTGRARQLLDWAPAVDSRDALADAVEGMVQGAGTASPVLRPRSLAGETAAVLRSGPKWRRREI